MSALRGETPRLPVAGETPALRVAGGPSRRADPAPGPTRAGRHRSARFGRSRRRQTEKTYREKLAQFTEVLRSHLRDTNLKTRWSEAYFTPLEAEVEIVNRVQGGGRSRRRIMDVMSAIRG
jgi:hypothetical protein